MAAEAIRRAAEALERDRAAAKMEDLRQELFQEKARLLAEAQLLEKEREEARQWEIDEEEARLLAEARVCAKEKERIVEQERLATEARVQEETRIREQFRLETEAKMADEAKFEAEQRRQEVLQLMEETRRLQDVEHLLLDQGDKYANNPMCRDLVTQQDRSRLGDEKK